MSEIRTFSVGEVAKRCGVRVSALHFYEQRALITSFRNHSNHRRYPADVIRRVSVIKAAQALGLSLNDIQSAFSTLPNNGTPSKKDWSRLSKQWREKLTEKILRLELLRENLDGCIGCGCLSLKACPLYNANDHLGKDKVGAVLLEPER